MGNERLLSALLERKGRIIGREVKFLCAAHEESNPSCYYNLDKRAWHCQSCGSSGGEKALCEALGLSWEPDPNLGTNRHSETTERPSGVVEMMSDGFHLTRLHTYRDAEGKVLGYAARYDSGSEKKVIPYFEFGPFRKGRGEGWLMKAPKEPRPLYGLDLLSKRPDERVWIVEGEKCADALRGIGLLAVTSQGGSKAASKTDWKPLAGRAVTIWPDNDEPGRVYLTSVSRALRDVGASAVDIIDVTAAGCTGDGDDCADWIVHNSTFTLEEMRDLIGSLLREKMEGVDVRDSTSTPAKETENQVNVHNSTSTPVAGHWQDGLELDRNARPKATEVNARKILREHPAWRDAYRWNARAMCVAIDRDLPIGLKRGETFRDCHYEAIAEWLHDVCDIENPPALRCGSAFVALAHEREFDPVADWLRTLKWDGEKRLDAWLSTASGCESNEYTRGVGSAFCISAVARALRPGAKVDTVLVLQGPQGALKSSLLAELAMRPEWFVDHVSEIGEKDAALQIAGPWIVEFSELDAITGKRENERVKSWLTQQKDRFRPPFGRAVIECPRRCVFSGTSNKSSFLRDDTGGRRYWPITVGKIDLGALREMREQIWAEAVVAFERGDKWWFDSELLVAAQEVQEYFRERDPWEDEIAAWIEETNWSSKNEPCRATNGARIYTTAREIMRDGLHIPVDRQTKNELDRVGRSLSVLGWSRAKRRVEGRVLAVWYPPPRGGEEQVVDIVREPVVEQTRFGGEDW